jgi:hypothetical protein
MILRLYTCFLGALPLKDNFQPGMNGFVVSVEEGDTLWFGHVNTHFVRLFDVECDDGIRCDGIFRKLSNVRLGTDGQWAIALTRCRCSVAERVA